MGRTGAVVTAGHEARFEAVVLRPEPAQNCSPSPVAGRTAVAAGTGAVCETVPCGAGWSADRC